MKLPEHERPPIEQIRQRLYDRVSASHRQLLVIDIQNDCACEVEGFDRSAMADVWYLSASGLPVRHQRSETLHLPMPSEISDADVVALFQATCQTLVPTTKIESTTISAVLANPQFNPQKIAHLLMHPVAAVVLMDWIPMETFYLLPEPEYVGCLSTNLQGFGAFASSDLIQCYQG